MKNELPWWTITFGASLSEDMLYGPTEWDPISASPKRSRPTLNEISGHTSVAVMSFDEFGWPAALTEYSLGFKHTEAPPLPPMVDHPKQQALVELHGMMVSADTIVEMFASAEARASIERIVRGTK